MNILKKKKYNKAVTLVEILVMLVVISLLAIFSIINAPTQIMKARDAVRKGNLDTMKKAIDEYYQDKDCYPLAIPACSNPLSLNGSVIKDSIPCDPKTRLSYTYIPQSAVCPKSFQMYTNLENTEDKIIDKIGCTAGCGPNCQYNYGVASTNQDLNPYCSEGAPLPGELPAIYACTPGGSCVVYADPLISGCPSAYVNDPTCQNQCATQAYRCHDERGRQE